MGLCHGYAIEMSIYFQEGRVALNSEPINHPVVLLQRQRRGVTGG